MHAFANTQKTDEKRAGALMIEARTMQALAYVPLMEIYASWLDGRDFDVDKTAQSLQKTKTDLVRLSALTLNRPAQGVTERMVRSRLAGEFLCSMLGQIDTPWRYMMLPASLRQANHVLPEKRADFLAISVPASSDQEQLAGGPLPKRRFSKSLVSVSLGKQKVPDAKTSGVVSFYAQDDFRMGNGTKINDTLKAIFDWQNGNAEPDKVATLEVLGRVMTGRLSDACRRDDPFVDFSIPGAGHNIDPQTALLPDATVAQQLLAQSPTNP
jgi:hypothetical protein